MLRAAPRSLICLACLSIGCVDAPAQMLDGSESGTDADSESESDSTGETSADMGTEPEPPALARCGSEPPAGASLAPPLPAYAGPGTCPAFETGTEGFNLMQTDHGEREFLVVAPTDPQADEVFGVLFMYHWLGGSAFDFVDRAEVQAAADFYRVIAIIPEGRDGSVGVPFRWPFSIADEEPLFDEEFAFHDDLLACVAEQFTVDENCVSSTGVSAGAMFTAMLASRHGDHLSSFISLSGGTGGSLVKPWLPAARAMPALVLWGGPDDVCLGVDFDANSMELEVGLEADDHFVVECVHNCTHAIPPFDPPEGSPLAGLVFEFVVDHPYWLAPGESPYVEYEAATGSLPPSYPDWCAIGAGNAQIRQGMCGGSEC